MRLAFVAFLLLWSLALPASGQLPAEEHVPASGQVPLPLGMPDFGPTSSFGFDGASDAAAPQFASGDGIVRLSLGGDRANAIGLHSLASSPMHAQVSLRLMHDGAPCLLPVTRLRRLRASDVLVREQTGSDGLCLRTIAAVADGALWLWCEASAQSFSDSSGLTLFVDIDDARLRSTVVRQVVGESTVATFAIAITPADEGAPKELFTATLLALSQAHARWRMQVQLTLDADQEPLLDFVRDATATLLAHRAIGYGYVTSNDTLLPMCERTGPLLSFLRFGLYDAARELLTPTEESSTTKSALASDCWTILQHGFYLRATCDKTPVLEHRERLIQNAAHAEAMAFADDVPFAEALLCVHALGTMGAMLDTLDRLAAPEAWRHKAPSPSAGSAWTQRTMRALQRLESRFWNESQGRFTPASAVAALLPCWTGWLLTSGEKTNRNVHTILRSLCREPATLLDPPIAAMLPIYSLVARTEFEQSTRADAIDAVLFAATPNATFQSNGELDPLATGAAVDAVLHALTGQRLAIGPGLAEDWLCLSPMVPRRARYLAVRGLAQDGVVCDLFVDRGNLDSPADRSPATTDWQATAANGNGWTRVSVVLQKAPAKTRLLVMHLHGQQIQGELQLGEVFTHTAQKTGTQVSNGQDASAQGLPVKLLYGKN